VTTATFAQLQAFLAVARSRNFSSAARDLGLSRSAVSQSVKQLEEQLQVVLLARTTRSVSLTDAGRRLVESGGPAFDQVMSSLSAAAARPGETSGHLRLSVPRAALPFVIDPVLPAFRSRHPRVEVEISIQDRLVDIVAEGYDAGVRHGEAIQRDMVQVRLTDPFRFVVVGSPAYLARAGTPQQPEDLLQHECLTFRSQTTGALFAWELERGKKTWRLPVRGGVVSSDGLQCGAMAVQGMGLAYAFEPTVVEHLRGGRLRRVLEAYAATVPGFCIYFPSRTQRSSPLRLFVETARELAVRSA
jgi:DNA-binding transcriptional LysR family regulator